MPALGRTVCTIAKSSKSLRIAECLTSWESESRTGNVRGLFVCRIACTSSQARHYVETHRRTINKMQRPDIMEAIRVALHKIPYRRHSKAKIR